MKSSLHFLLYFYDFSDYLTFKAFKFAMDDFGQDLPCVPKIIVYRHDIKHRLDYLLEMLSIQWPALLRHNITIYWIWLTE